MGIVCTKSNVLCCSFAAERREAEGRKIHIQAVFARDTIVNLIGLSFTQVLLLCGVAVFLAASLSIHGARGG